MWTKFLIHISGYTYNKENITDAHVSGKTYEQNMWVNVRLWTIGNNNLDISADAWDYGNRDDPASGKASINVKIFYKIKVKIWIIIII